MTKFDESIRDMVVDLTERRNKAQQAKDALRQAYPEAFGDDERIILKTNDVPQDTRIDVLRGAGRLLLRNKIWWICWSENWSNTKSIGTASK